MSRDSRHFSDFGEASAFARNLAVQNRSPTLVRDGEAWLVTYLPTELAPEPPINKTDVALLTKDLEASRAQLREAQVIQNSLQERLIVLEKELAEKALQAKSSEASFLRLRQDLQGEMATKINLELAKERKALDEKVRHLEKEVIATQTVRSNYEFEKARFELLERAYAEKFGRAEISKVESEVIKNNICPKCHGTGGIREGCQRCEGTGWVTDIKYKDVVVIDPPDKREL